MTEFIIAVSVLIFIPWCFVGIADALYKHRNLMHNLDNREPPERHLCRGCKRTILPDDGICEDCEQAIQDALDYERANREADAMIYAGCRDA